MSVMIQPVLLGVDQDRREQVRIATAFNERGVTYRFLTDSRKVRGGVRQLSPGMVMVYGDLSSDFVIRVIDALAADVATGALPVVACCPSLVTSDTAIVGGMRSGVVGVLKAPFDPATHIDDVLRLWRNLSSRTGSASGQSDAKGLAALVDHLRRTRRSGVFTTQPRSPSEGRASFVRGKLQRASYLGLVSQDALKAMVAQPSTRWVFQEVAGQQGDGAGVVIEVGVADVSDQEVADVVVGEDEPLAFEVAITGPTAQPAPDVPPTIAPVVHTGPQANLLLVDDDEALLRMFATLFAKHHFQVTTASDGREGVELARTKPVDIVLADLNMPRLDGWGLLRLLREDFRTREVPVAFISAHDDYRESLRALDAGAQAYISKGARLDSLVAQVKKLLGPRQEVAAQLDGTGPYHVVVAAVGPQWLLRQIASRKLTGELVGKDGWAKYTLAFDRGVCTHASAIAGKYAADGERAFNAFVASRAAEATFTPGSYELPQNLFLPTEATLDRACATLNENEERMRDNLMVSATQIEVNAELYAVYAHVGPQPWLETARLICEEHLPPREVIAKVDLSPLEVEEAMRDLIRRGVVTLKRA